LRSIRGETMKDAVWDIFICHAEDKDEIAKRLANALRELGVSVWGGEFSLELGDSLRELIDRGLLRSKFGSSFSARSFSRSTGPRRN